MAKAIYHYSIKFEYLINDQNYELFKLLFIIIMSIYGFIIFLLNFSIINKKVIKKINIEEQMFLVGGGIFIGTFLTAANIDYRLIFLILTIPYLVHGANKFFINIYFFVLFLCFNSLLFQSGDPYGYFYAFKGFFIYLFKITIFTVNCYYFGIILNKFIDFNLNKLKKLDN